MEKTLYNKIVTTLCVLSWLQTWTFFTLRLCLWCTVEQRNFVILLTKNNTYNSKDNQKDACDNIIKSMMAGNNYMTTVEPPKKKRRHIISECKAHLNKFGPRYSFSFFFCYVPCTITAKFGRLLVCFRLL